MWLMPTILDSVPITSHIRLHLNEGIKINNSFQNCAFSFASSEF